jgi:hypothetical protein
VEKDMGFKIDTVLIFGYDYFQKGEKIEFQLLEDDIEYIGILKDFSEICITVEINGELKQYNYDEVSGIYKLE